MKRIIVTKKQLNEYIEIKKSEKIFYEIVNLMYKNIHFLNENISYKNANQTIINNYKRKNLITPKVYEMLIKHKIINENYEII